MTLTEVVTEFMHYRFDLRAQRLVGQRKIVEADDKIIARTRRHAIGVLRTKCDVADAAAAAGSGIGPDGVMIDRSSSRIVEVSTFERVKICSAQRYAIDGV